MQYMLFSYPLENTEIGTALIHHVQGKLSWSNFVIIYMCKKCPNTPVIRSLFYPFISTYDIYYQQFFEMLLN